jgi:uncharacterized protein YkwD
MLNRLPASVSVAIALILPMLGLGLGFAGPAAPNVQTGVTPTPTSTFGPAAWLPLVRRAQATATSPSTSTPTPTSTAAPSAEWLARLNFLRSIAGVPPVTENPAWSDGCFKHARYMVKNSVIGHTEDPSNPWYSPEGQDAALYGNQAANTSLNFSDAAAVDSWMLTVFHGVVMIDPQLLQSGFGSYHEAGGLYQSAACLDVNRGRGAVPAGVTYPILWPPAGATFGASTLAPEVPDTLSSCPGYSAPAGFPIMLQLGAGNVTPVVTGHTFSRSGTPLEHCVYDQTTYTNSNSSDQTTGRLILAVRSAVALIPRAPLTAGSYAVSITANGQTYSWSFTIS